MWLNVGVNKIHERRHSLYLLQESTHEKLENRICFDGFVSHVGVMRFVRG